jgi:hypothetical protein
MGFFESIRFAYQRVPAFLKGKISIDIRNPNIPILLFVFMLFIIGAISNGILLHMDNNLIKCLSKIYPNEYELT